MPTLQDNQSEHPEDILDKYLGWTLAVFPRASGHVFHWKCCLIMRNRIYRHILNGFITSGLTSPE